MFNKLKESKIEDKLLFVLFLGITASLVLAFILSAFRSMVNADAGYYLGVTELIRQGYVPYRDFRLGYTPLFFYVLQIPRLFMGTYPDYTGYMLFLYLIAALDAFLLAIIIKRVTNNVKFAWLFALVFLELYLYLDGAYFILETFSLCCGLVSLVLLVKKDVSLWRCLLSGSFCAMAFLSKQYGLLFAGVIGMLLLLSGDEWRSRILHCMYALTGFCTVIVLFAALLMLSGIGMKDLVMALSGSTYGVQSIRLYLEGLIKTGRLFPYLLFIPCMLFAKKDQDTPFVWACCIGLMLTSFQFYFNVFPHYFIYMLPFALVLSVMMWKQLKVRYGSGLCFLFYFGVLFTACALPMQSVYKDTKTLAKHNLRAAQEKTAIQLRQALNDNGMDSALCYGNTVQYYGLCPIKPSSIQEFGFAFGYDDENTLAQRLNDADCFIVQRKDFDEISEMKVLSGVLSKYFHLLDQIFEDGTVLFVRNK